jgi:hypothetical protein
MKVGKNQARLLSVGQLPGTRLQDILAAMEAVKAWAWMDDGLHPFGGGEP